MAVSAATNTSTLTDALIRGRSCADALGEVLREVVFPGEGYGCYTTFDWREGAVEWDEARLLAFWTADSAQVAKRDGWGAWSRDGAVALAPEELLADVVAWRARESAEMAHGATFTFDDCTVHCSYYWDGDGELRFVVCTPDGEPVRYLANTDCKKSYRWEEMDAAVFAGVLGGIR